MGQPFFRARFSRRIRESSGPSTPELKRTQKEYSQPWEIYLVLTTEVAGRPLATLHELQTVYSVEDLYDFIETIDVYLTVMEEQHKEAERKAQMTK